MEVPGVGQLFDELDKRLMVYLRDGRTLIGILRTVDQFGNLVLHRTIERIHVGKRYGDIERGVIIIRGENIVLTGLWDAEKAEQCPLEQVSVEEIMADQRAEQTQQQHQQQLRARFLKGRGLTDTLDINNDDTY